ncbi:uncharacterized protein M421DRAFT_74763 [Didymella exigua CBS 183.55]|uniref:TEA domain-containing protein n=1 Tax=Didymella exigua CBS 183.55 TaxID=1150837 RepID=A0A6A5R9G9_9PLEO|nr:uncharacterized protein M421DRAFT_74763 [Didymella exigua CBS 183.55]KAF1923654.1 hypothetical protein M421DRAFT_74763 [Didymella exigua CBS 183.55]
MELQHRQSGLLSGNCSALNTPSVGTPLDGPSSQHRSVLQERSANWPHDNTASPLTGTQAAVQKASRSQSPTENVYTQQSTNAGGYFTGNLHAPHHIGLAGHGVERNEEQISRDIKKLYALLNRSDKYQKYREKQPQLTPQQFIEREAREAKMKIDKDNKSPEKSVWPEFLEHAFWRALIRWPPMGRKKFLLDNALRGRNELIQDSIYKDTGIRRDRKQVSSHLQVLKQHLKDQPHGELTHHATVLVYMATKDEDKKRHRGREAANSYHLSHLGARHHPSQRVGGGSKYDYSAPVPFWSGLSSLQSSLGLSFGATGASPYTVTDFTMLVEDADQPVHDFTSLSRDGRQPELSVADTSLWHRQYPEFTFLQKQTDEWARKQHKVLICDASIKVMTETRPNAHLSIAFDLHSHRDLRPFDSLVCTTRFYDDGKMNADPQFDGPHHQDLKEHRTSCEYTPDPHGCSGRLRLAFGSRFWVNRMSKYQTLRHKDDGLVGRSLMKLTATQDVYGINSSGGAECVLTILWRFRQTRDSVEVGQMKWRAVSFGASQPGMKQEWIKQESLNSIDSELLEISTSQSQPPHPTPLYHQQSTLEQLAHHAYAVQPYHTQPPPPQLHIDTLASWPCTAPGLSTPSASAAPSTATDHSFASMPHMPHSQDTASGFDTNDFDFTGGRIDISGAFSPAIMAGYEAFASQSGDMGGLNALSGMDHQSLLEMGLSANDIAAIGVTPTHALADPSLSQLGAGTGVQNCYSTKPVPSWAHSGALISSLESQAEGYVSPWTARSSHSQGSHQVPQHHHVHAQHTPSLPISTYGNDELVGHGSLHSSTANLNPALWNLASPFHEDTSSGALSAGLMGNMGVNHSVMERKDSMQQNGLGLGVLDLIERDQRARGY